MAKSLERIVFRIACKRKEKDVSQRRNNNMFFDPRSQGMQLPMQPKPKRWQLRWTYLWVILAIAGVAIFLNSIESSVAWQRVMDALDVQNRERYTQLFCLGVVVTTICAIYRVLRKDGR